MSSSKTIMKIIITIIVGLLLQNLTSAKDATTIGFVKHFIVNEQKPTHLIYSGLCWRKHITIKLVTEMSKIAIRTSSSLEARPKYQDHTLLFLTDLDCQESIEFIQQAISKKLFELSYRWLLLISSSAESRLPIILDSPVLADSDLVLAERIGDQFKMVELHKPSPNAKMQSALRGYYDEGLIDIRPRRELYQRRRNLLGYPITMSNCIQDSNTTQYHMPRLDRLEIHYDSVTKACWATALHVYELLNATPRFIYSYRYGYKVNGNWSGMIDDFANNRAEFGTSCLIFGDRLDVVTYTDFVASIRMYFVFRQPPLAYISNVFYMPFSTHVWTTVLVCTALGTFALYLASKWEASIERSPSQLDGGISDALLLSFSAFTQQGSFVEPKRSPGRIMSFVLFMALMALYAAYSANIVVLLQAPSNSIKTLAQLAGAKITLGATKTDYQQFILSQMNDSLHKSIHNRIYPEGGKPQLYSITDGVERIRQGLFALHSIIAPVYHQIEATFLESEKCDIGAIDLLNSFESFTPVRKGSPYLELLRVSYKRVKESGIHSAILKRYFAQKPRCTNRVAAFNSVGLLDLQPVLVIMLYGILLSIMIAIGEIIVFKLSKKYKLQSAKKWAAASLRITRS